MTQEQRSLEFQKQWADLANQNKKAYSRVAAQRELLVRWANRDIDAALHAMLNQPWDGGSHSDQDLELALSDILGKELAEQEARVLESVEAGEFGILGGSLVRKAVLIALARESPESIIDRIGSLGERDVAAALSAISLSSYQDFRRLFDGLSARSSIPVEALLDGLDRSDPFNRSLSAMTAGALNRNEMLSLISSERPEVSRLLIESLAMHSHWHSDELPLIDAESLPPEFKTTYQESFERVTKEK
ncbi:hypothetical protein [Roseibacillus persicicus]|uniref:hypothetical protein n=1 Tax=Roseibacillus persicicus TaxID=454148 RepID=UPI001674FC9B|nr:hypothetical protein [Roseibacillus persicicus]